MLLVLRLTLGVSPLETLLKQKNKTIKISLFEFYTMSQK